MNIYVTFFCVTFAGQQKLIVSQPGVGVQPRLIVPAQHLTLLTSNGSGGMAPQTMMEPKKEGTGFFRGRYDDTKRWMNNITFYDHILYELMRI